MTRALLLAVAAAVAFAACADTDPGTGAALTVVNRTDTPVGVYVNDEWVGTDEPGATIETTLRPSDDAALRIEARSPTGAVLAAFDAPSAEVDRTREGGPALGAEYAVPCGVLTILIGTLRDDEGLAPAASVEPGPCP